MAKPFQWQTSSTGWTCLTRPALSFETSLWNASSAAGRTKPISQCVGPPPRRWIARRCVRHFIVCVQSRFLTQVGYFIQHWGHVEDLGPTCGCQHNICRKNSFVRFTRRRLFVHVSFDNSEHVECIYDFSPDCNDTRFFTVVSISKIQLHQAVVEFPFTWSGVTMIQSLRPTAHLDLPRQFLQIGSWWLSIDPNDAIPFSGDDIQDRIIQNPCTE